MDNFKVSIRNIPGSLSYDVFVWIKSFDGKITSIVDGGKRQETKDIGEIMKPFCFLNPHLLQPLTDALSKLGYVPKAGFLEGKIEAQEKHLEDMRTLVFKK